MEPEILRRGKEFHRRVQAEWAGEIEGAPVHSEHGIIFGSLSKTVKHQRRGRLDIFISQFEDFVCVIEIKVPTPRWVQAFQLKAMRYCVTIHEGVGSTSRLAGVALIHAIDTVR